MSAYFSVGIVLIILGLVFLLLPLEQLRKAFPRMRSPITTKIGGAVFLVGGIAMVILGMQEAL